MPSLELTCKKCGISRTFSGTPREVMTEIVDTGWQDMPKGYRADLCPKCYHDLDEDGFAELFKEK